MNAPILFACGVALGATPAPAATATTARSGDLAVLILPTERGPVEGTALPLDARTIRAFSGALGDAAASVLSWRRWLIAARRVLPAKGEKGCASEACAIDAGARIGAAAVLVSRLDRPKEDRCAASVALFDRLDPRRSKRLSEEILPCTADNVLGVATDLGRRIAEGPRAPLTVTHDLTPLDLRAIDIPDLPDLREAHATETSTVMHPRRGFTLERALEIYQAKHMFVFEDDSRPGGVFVARNDHLVNECDLRRAASAPLTSAMIEFCEGNSWEYAWVGFPVGLVIAGLGVGDVKNGGWFTVLFGASVATASAVVATLFNVDANDVQSGRHFSRREQIEAIVHKSNANLRSELELTDADIEVAGMRR